ncbi:hypothetical protein [Alkalibacterium pelagium]|uniref:Uncharacterized protein n=1 Tax=Alkalibacterium pelagium TaxID=426702 RepID=A0A1H7PG96_9LACT|nr:hypothetical protein [Alkalibacterium pelagium]GEN51623.1 hypothetical protein APE02nite_22880 [Alkalibacterium pelagium]SEL34649.1 hypothetical protein SAMN04488099_12018 [Alkalibacterium pelagium]
MTEPIIDIIKGHSGDYSMINLLMGYTKRQMMQIADSHGLTLPKSWKKNKVAEALKEKILHQAQTLYQEILDEVLSVIPENTQNSLLVEDSQGLNSFAPLIQKGFFFAVKADDSYIVIIPDDLKDAVNEGRPEQVISQTALSDWQIEEPADQRTNLKSQSSDEEKVTKDQSEHTYYLLLKWKKQLTAIYGGFSISHLHEVWNRYYTDSLTEEEITEILTD